MKVESSCIAMQSEHELKQKSSMSFESLLESGAPAPVKTQKKINEAELLDRFHFALIRQLLEMLQQCTCKKQPEFEPMQEEMSTYDAPVQLRREKVNITQTKSVYEKLEVSMKGHVKTDKGTIDLDIALSLSRSFVQTKQLAQGDLIDPLVFNFKGELPKFDSGTFCFDIDSDGEADQISRLVEGNGFLALDKNGNGKIDNGKELFGAKSGNGFAELVEYDSDNNGWIDANDPIMDKLRIWMKSGKEDRLVTLAEAGIGAIYLGQTASPFWFTDEENQTLGRVRTSGVYLGENGGAGTIAQLDFCKQKTSVQTEKPQEFLAQALMAV